VAGGTGSLAALALTSVPFLRSIGLAGMLIPLISLIVSATLLPVILDALARAPRSLWLPVKAPLLNLISLSAAFGVLTFVWQEGHGVGALFNSPATGAVTLWVPLAVFALLFGLSMDYEVFILTRINEEYAKTGDTGEAVVRGIGRTGRPVTPGALIFANGGLVAAPR